MARKSDISGKGALVGNNRSHALNATRRKWEANLQKVQVVDPKTGAKTTVKMTAKELKTMKKQAGLK